ncbi:MAG: hypothetical protein WEE36_04745 [Acidimicrobiia bacterium]
MKGLAVLVGLLVMVTIGLGIGLGGSTPDDQPTTRVRADHVGMPESDQLMLQQMRSGTSPGMTPMIREDPMWVDPDMIKAQEEYQAQLDRMVGKRPGR